MPGPPFAPERRMVVRTFSPQDFTSALDSKWSPLVINEAFAQYFFKNQNPSEST